MNTDLFKEINAAITFCDVEGKIIEMNDKAAEMFADDGGYGLIGKSLFGCHSEQSNKIIKGLIEGKKTNVYTIEKKGIKKLIFQSPWFVNGEIKGLMEISIEIPFDMPHHIRS
jgi:transcriptional regulator with PAS, ATPase and Fis domain